MTHEKTAMVSSMQVIPELRVSSTLDHDGDGYVRFFVRMANADFAAATMAWGSTDTHLDLANALEGFPKASSPPLTCTLGSEGTGTCALEFSTNNLGRVRVWATIVGPYPEDPSGRYEQAVFQFECEPTAVDRFVTGLRGFVSGEDNRAVLTGLPVRG